MLTAVLSLLLGYPLAYFLARTRSAWRGVLMFLVIAPLMSGVGARAIGVAERGYRLMLGERWTVLEAVAGPECDPM